MRSINLNPIQLTTSEVIQFLSFFVTVDMPLFLNLRNRKSVKIRAYLNRRALKIKAYLLHKEFNITGDLTGSPAPFGKIGTGWSDSLARDGLGGTTGHD